MWRAIQGLLRITLGRTIPPAIPPSAEARLGRALDRIIGPAAARPLADRVALVADEVRAAFRRHVGDIQP